MIVTSKKTIYWMLYSLLLLFTIYFSFTFISQKIEERKEFEIFKDSWQYVADTNFKQSVEIDPETNEQKVYNEISTPEQLAGMFLNTDSNSLKAEKLSDISTEYKLTKNIDLNGKTWISSDFSEVLDGGSFIISNLKISSNNATVGFILKLTGTVKDLFFSNVNIEYSGDGSVEYKMGVVCGESNNGKISNVYIKSGSVVGKIGKNTTKSYIGGIVGFMQGTKPNIENCYNNATIKNGTHMGGIVGNVDSGTVTRCVNNGKIIIDETINLGTYNLIEYLFIKGKVFNLYCGGIAGYYKGGNILSLCINRASLTTKILQKINLNNGISLKVMSLSNATEIMVGGIVGYSTKSIDKCYNTGEINGGDDYNETTYVGGIAGKSLNTINNCYNTGNLICKSRPIKNDQSIENTNTQVETLKVFRSIGLGWRDCWLKIWTGSYKEDNTKDINQYDNKTTYQSFVGGIVGYSTKEVKNSYNIGKITSNSDNYSITKMLTAELWYDDVGGMRYSDTFVYQFNIKIPTNISGINGNRSIGVQNCYSDQTFNYSLTKSIDYYLNMCRESTEKGTTTYYITDQGTGAWGYGTQKWKAETSAYITSQYQNNKIYCKAYMENSTEGRENTSDQAQTRYAIDKTIDFYKTNYKINIPSASSLDSTVWTSNSNINNGYPYLKDLYW